MINIVMLYSIKKAQMMSVVMKKTQMMPILSASAKMSHFLILEQ
jgi:hypothetical protein